MNSCWCSVDAQFPNRAVTESMYVLPTQAAKTSGMHNNDKLNIQKPYYEDQLSLTLQWRWFKESGIDRVTIAFCL